MREDDSVWGRMLGKLEEHQKGVLEKYVSSISLEPPYSAPVTTVLRCWKRTALDLEYGGFQSLPSRASMILGLVFDFGGKVLLEGYPPREHYRAKEYVDEEGVRYVVHAAPDAVLEDRVVELKFTTMPVEKLPLEHHVAQLKMYMNVYGMPGSLVYLTPHGVREYFIPLEEGFSDEEVVRILRGFFRERRSPAYEWECDYCYYRQVCPLARTRPQD